MADALRLFIAVELPKDLLARISQVMAKLRQENPAGIRWVRQEGMHLTLKFLGNVPEERVPAILSAMSQAVAGTPPFPLQVHGAGAFPNIRAPRVLWLGVLGHLEPLLTLQVRLEEALEGQGFPRESRAFSAHLTLARINGRLAPPALERLAYFVEQLRALEPWPLSVEALSLMESRLTPQGALYSRKGQAFL